MMIAGTNPSDKTLTIEGKFISKTMVRYEVYLVKDSTLTLERKGHSLKYFTINVEIGEQYVVKFISKDDEVKYLYLDAPENGLFMVNVDFNKKGSAKLEYNHKKEKYNVTLIDTCLIALNVKRKNTY